MFADFCLAVFIVAVLIAFVSNRRDAELLPEENGESDTEAQEDDVYEENEIEENSDEAVNEADEAVEESPADYFYAPDGDGE